jgi:hypothetical protein
MSNTRTPARQPKKRSSFLVGGATIASFVALLYVVEFFDQIDGHHLDDYGIRPMEADGLWGILFAPLLHANWAHLAANTGPALVLGFLVALAGLSRFLWATAIIWIVGGFGTWLIGNSDCWCWSSTAACCGEPCRCSTSAEACPGRGICAVDSPGCSPRTCCPARNAKRDSVAARGRRYE